MSVFRKSTYCAPCLVGLLIVSITFTGCPALLSQIVNGDTSTNESQDGTAFNVFQDTSPDSPFSYIAVNSETGDRVGLLAQKDEDGNPTAAQGAVLAQPTGKGWVVVLGDDGLPEQIIAADASKIHFANWTDKTVDVSLASALSAKAADVQTVSLDEKTVGRLAKLREMNAEKTTMSGAGIGLSIAVLILSLAAGGLSVAFDEIPTGIPAFIAAVATFTNLLLDSPAGWLTAVTCIGLFVTIGIIANSTPQSEEMTLVGGVSALTLILALIAAALPPGTPTTPVTITPGNGAFAEGTEVTVTWQAVENATGYECQLAETSDFADPQTSDVITDTSFTWSTMPDDSSIWYWRVRAQNDKGWSDYSSARSFCNGSIVGTWDATPNGCYGEMCEDQPDVFTFSSDGTWTAHDHNGRTIPGTYTVASNGTVYGVLEDSGTYEGYDYHQICYMTLYPFNGTLSGHASLDICFEVEGYEDCYSGGTDLDLIRAVKQLVNADVNALPSQTSLWKDTVPRSLTVTER